MPIRKSLSRTAAVVLAAASMILGGCLQKSEFSEKVRPVTGGSGLDKEVQDMAVSGHDDETLGGGPGISGASRVPAPEHHHLHHEQIRSLLISLGADEDGAAIRLLDRKAGDLGRSDYERGIRTDLSLTASKVKDLFRIYELACDEIVSDSSRRDALFPEGPAGIDRIWLAVLTRYPDDEERRLVSGLVEQLRGGPDSAYVGVCVVALNSLEGVSQ